MTMKKGKPTPEARAGLAARMAYADWEHYIRTNDPPIPPKDAFRTIVQPLMQALAEGTDFDDIPEKPAAEPVVLDANNPAPIWEQGGYCLLPWEAMAQGFAPNQMVMQRWTAYLSLREQGVLVQALRGPDGLTKESKAKPLVRAIRGVSMVSAKIRSEMRMGLVFADDPYMQTVLIGSPSDLAWKMAVKDFLSDVDAHNIHWYQHFSQAWACVGIGHPDQLVRGRAWDLYVQMAHVFHWMPETVFEFRNRLKDGPRSA